MKKCWFPIIITLLLIFALYKYIPAHKRKVERRNLANLLGVSLENYPPETYFPASYFRTQLKEGMSIDEVHEIFQGYEQVYRCGKVTEIYYFYDTEDDKADRLQVFYDWDLAYISFETEDSDSKYFNVKECELGLLQ